ncbi:MAG: hypothetical protein ACTJHT_13940 [Sphingobacterium sp.]|uniref:hypothetical protein n=1 Tax=Sphingobacterium sp. JB170 TaxID=1434842 RepID=UPI00097EEFE5|nr:hypothetical protein [Sphingobacterium sp. JB170]SJN45545.1 hypothetical protein FM107_13750 [Sphingobacterium sp. JB170]
MKVLSSFFFLALVVALASCSNAGDQTDNTENPGPVSEMDQSRYNLNQSDKSLYGTTDTLNEDSLSRDSLDRQDSLPETSE